MFFGELSKCLVVKKETVYNEDLEERSFSLFLSYTIKPFLSSISTVVL
jgi:hypothetical protein